MIELRFFKGGRLRRPWRQPGNSQQSQGSKHHYYLEPTTLNDHYTPMTSLFPSI